MFKADKVDLFIYENLNAVTFLQPCHFQTYLINFKLQINIRRQFVCRHSWSLNVGVSDCVKTPKSKQLNISTVLKKKTDFNYPQRKAEHWSILESNRPNLSDVLSESWTLRGHVDGNVVNCSPITWLCGTSWSLPWCIVGTFRWSSPPPVCRLWSAACVCLCRSGGSLAPQSGSWRCWLAHLSAETCTHTHINKHTNKHTHTHTSEWGNSYQCRVSAGLTN